MSAVLIGGMDRLHRQYKNAAADLGVGLKVFSGQERSVEKQLGSAELLILCTAKVSHSAKIEVMEYARAKGIPVQLLHSAGVSSLRCCLKQCALCDGGCVSLK